MLIVIEENDSLRPEPQLPPTVIKAPVIHMPLKRPKLMSYKAEATTQITVTTKSPREELFFYLANVDLLDPENFWKLHLVLCCCIWFSRRKSFLCGWECPSAKKVQNVSAKTLASLVFLKCNFELL